MDASRKSISDNLEFFILIGKLKHLKRTGWVLRNIPECETVAGHMYRMSIMAFLLGKDVCPHLDRDKCIKMALVHDIAECIVGDLTPFCGISKEEKHIKEMEAMKRLSGLVPKNIGQEFLDLFTEYEEQVTAEAKAVKDLDKLDMILQAYEYESQHSISLQGFFDSTEGTFENHAVSKWVEELKSLRATAINSVQNPDEK